jgi:formate-dependent nitrite reductase membrane component NrfD
VPQTCVYILFRPHIIVIFAFQRIFCFCSIMMMCLMLVRVWLLLLCSFSLRLLLVTLPFNQPTNQPTNQHSYDSYTVASQPRKELAS